MGIPIEQKRPSNTADKREKTESIFKKDIVVFSKPFGSKKKEAFYVELSLLLKAGVRLKNALSLLADAQKKKADKVLLKRLNAYDALKTKKLRIFDKISDDSFKKQSYLPDINHSQAAYVIFTSGTTSMAKGVEVSHP